MMWPTSDRITKELIRDVTLEREQRGWTMMKLSEESGVSRHTVQKLEGGKTVWLNKTVMKIMHALGLKYNDYYPKKKKKYDTTETTFAEDRGKIKAEYNTYVNDLKTESKEKTPESTAELTALVGSMLEIHIKEQVLIGVKKKLNEVIINIDNELNNEGRMVKDE